MKSQEEHLRCAEAAKIDVVEALRVNYRGSSHTCFKEGSAYNEHGHKQDDIGINEACECGFDIENACDTEADADDHGCKA